MVNLKGKRRKRNENFSLIALTFAALGVVFGDIGTSPLYAINEMFFGHAQVAITYMDVVGSISLVVWALTIIISLKYVIFVMAADNDGEGGVFALLELLKGTPGKFTVAVTALLVLAAGLLFGDGIITPAISVLSAVEGLKVVTSAFEPYIIPITITILTALFFVQSRGTYKVGKIFGPITTVWFLTIATLGILSIIEAPQIFNAFNPYFAISFLLKTKPIQILAVLGSVMLVITGGEALYADMGHFGKKPIRIGWFSIVYPCLILQYLGQGAYLLSGREILSQNIFYSMVPSTFLIPVVILATLATVIASQALITGVFSLSSQAISLGLMPLLKVEHTHEKHEGQVYVKTANWALFIGCILIVLFFKTSSNLAAAYGLAVSGCELVTSLAMIALVRNKWHWSIKKIALTFGIFALIDTLFLTSNSLKFFQGGYVPLSLGLIFYVIMSTWQWGKQKAIEAYKSVDTITLQNFMDKRKLCNCLLQRSVVMFSRKPITSKEDTIPILLQIFWDKYLSAPKNLIFFTLNVSKEPYIAENRYKIYRFTSNKDEGEIVSIIANYGYMENPDIESLLEELAKDKTLPISENPQDWIIEIGHERFIVAPTMSVFNKLRFALYQVLKQFAAPGYHYLGLKDNLHLFIEVFPEYIK